MLYLHEKYISLQKYRNMYIFKYTGFFYMGPLKAFLYAFYKSILVECFYRMLRETRSSPPDALLFVGARIVNLQNILHLGEHGTSCQSMP